jgi:hypothetical protein
LFLSLADISCAYIWENFTKHSLNFAFRLPGNTRTKIGFITFDSTIHFYSLQEGLSQPQMLIVSDIEGMCFALSFIEPPQGFFHFRNTS